MSMQMRRILGNPEALKVVKAVPFEPGVVDFLDAVSKAIMKHPESRKIPGLHAFGFWCRKKHLLQLKAKYQISDERCGKGLVFHICASNIPGLFAWSMVIGLLMGNSNLVRVSAGENSIQAAKAFCEVFEHVLNQKQYRHLADRMAVVTYPKENELLTIHYSEMCGLRVIWGGDRAIETITGLSCQPMPEDIVFPDRVSAAVIDAEALNSMHQDELELQARLFYDDTYAMDQNACSSPQLIVWRGGQESCQRASLRWWQAVGRQLTQYAPSEKQIYDKYSLACEVAMNSGCESVQWWDKKLCHIWMDKLPADWSEFRGNSGIFLECRIDTDEEIKLIDSEKLQTLLVLGIDQEELQKMIEKQRMQGVSRIVPFGQALEMDLVWDGQDLTKRLTEPDFFKWQWEYDDRCMLMDDKGSTVTYGEARLFGKTYFGGASERSLILLITENTMGSVLTYIQSLRHDLVPILMDKKTNHEQLMGIIDKYRPEYAAVPEKYMMHPGKDYEEKWRSKGYIYYARKTEEESCKLYKDLALLLSTSGSTGSPKFVKISKMNLQSNTSSIASYLHITESDRPITTLPMSYTYGLSIINSHLYRGATILLTEASVMEQTFWDFFKKQQATTFGGVPYTYKMLKFIGFLDMQLPSLKIMTQAGGKLPVSLQKIFTAYGKAYDRPLIVMYGQTEATARMAYLPWKDAEQKQGSIGIAIPGGRFWLKDTSESVITDSYKTGELIYDGPNVTMGYAVDRRSLMTGDENHGRLATGDLAYRDDDGFYYIAGRKKRFIKLLGNRISLDETEELLNQAFPETEFVCAGTDEQMKVFCTGDIGDEKAIISYLSDKLHLFYKNFSVRKIKKIPRNTSGKVLYEQLEEQ